MTDYLEILNELDEAPPVTEEVGWREITVDKTGVPRQAGSTHPEGAFIKKFRRLAESNLHVFGKGVIGRSYLTDHLHLPVANYLQQTPPFRKMLLMPRDHAKTSIVSHCLPVHILIQPATHNLYFPGLEGCECRILLGGSSAGRAEKNLSVIGKAFTSNATMRALWPHRCYENERHAKSVAGKWNAQEIIIPREENWPDSSVFAVGVGVEVAGARPNVQIKDDLIGREAANSEAMMRDAIDWHKASRALMDEYEKDSGLESLEFIIGCLTNDAEVLMRSGVRKRIENVEEGEFVWSANTDGFFSQRKVTKKIFQGYAETYTIKTTAHTLRATSNHPFLVSGGRNDLVWKRLDALEINDLVVTVKSIPKSIMSALPDYDIELCWLFGFMLGDGWCNTRDRRGYVCFSAGIDEEQNERVIDGWQRYFKCNKIYMTEGRYYRTDNVETARKFAEMGLIGKAKTKRLPSWAYKVSPEHRRALLQGFCDADGGWQSHRLWNVEISNKKLLKDLRHLANLCGVRTGILGKRERVLQPPNSPHPIRAVCWRTSFNFSTVGRVEMSGSPGKLGKNVGRDTKMSEHLRFERVTSITRNKVAEAVYDLTVEGTPSFFANGFAVHNTRWAVFDLYAFVLQGDEEVGPDLSVEVMVRRILEKDAAGDLNPIWAERFPAERIDQLRREFGSMFYLLYMNEASDPNLVDFDLNQVRQFTLGGSTGSEILFDENNFDAMLEARYKQKPEDFQDTQKTPLQGIPLNADTWDMHFGKGRGQYMRFKYS